MRNRRKPLPLTLQPDDSIISDHCTQIRSTAGIPVSFLCLAVFLCSCVLFTPCSASVALRGPSDCSHADGNVIRSNVYSVVTSLILFFLAASLGSSPFAYVCLISLLSTASRHPYCLALIECRFANCFMLPSWPYKKKNVPS